MIIILSVILGALAYVASKQIRKYFVGLIALTSVLAVLSIMIEVDATQIITQGFIGLAFFVVVMFAGAFPKQSKVSKRFRSVRKEYSILGFILLIPHAYEYIVQFLDGSYPTEWIGILAMLVMVPLFITSFNKIKKKMGIKNWKELQKWAYLAYALTFIHLIIVSEGANQITYIIILSLYSFLKLWNYVFVTKRKQERLVLSLIAVVIVSGVSYFGTNTEELFSSNFSGVNYSSVELDDGIYTGSSNGFKNLPTELTVIVENGKITEIVFDAIGATSPHHGVDYEQAAYDMVTQIINNQSTDVDSISGATKTADSVLQAVNEALENQIETQE